MDSLSLQNPVFATYVIAATLMILKAPWTASVCRGISLLSTGRAIPKDLPPRSTVYDYFDLSSRALLEPTSFRSPRGVETLKTQH